MDQVKLFFKITADNNCPLYDKGEILTLTDKALLCPDAKETCLILVREMTNILFAFLDSGSASGEAEKKDYNCSGCSGLIKFSLISEEEAMRDDVPAPAPPSLDPEGELLLTSIRDFPLIQAIPEAELVRVVRCFRKEHLAAGSTFITKGQHCLYLYLILSGNIVVSDNSLTIASLGAGDICGEMSYLGGDVAGADVRAVTEADVLSISADAFSQLLDRIPQLQLFMAKILVQRLTEANATHFETFDAGMSGWIREMSPVELFQIFHMNQKTGLLTLELPQGEAKVSFREGCIINAQYKGMTNQNAIFELLKEKEGHYTFSSGLSPEEMKAAEIGDFMMLLMEGIKRVDEASEGA